MAVCCGESCEYSSEVVCEEVDYSVRRVVWSDESGSWLSVSNLSRHVGVPVTGVGVGSALDWASSGPAAEIEC